MNVNKLEIQAQMNFFHLAENPYPGRGFVVGTAEHARYGVQVYWIMGRSEGSRNRRFDAKGGRVATELADPAKFTGSQEELNLIIYNAMDEANDFFVVSNGSQTDTVTREVASGESLDAALEPYTYEPDAPNYTPRITAVSSIKSWSDYEIEMTLLRRSTWSDNCDENLYRYANIGAGYGYCLTTYMGDGNPLPAFRGEPRLMPLRGSLYDIATTYWEALNEANRVALAVKLIDWQTKTSEVKIINKHN